MKKIVALVLSLVMVLGLATTAFAATTSTGSVSTTSVTPVKAALYDLAAAGESMRQCGKDFTEIKLTTVSGKVEKDVPMYVPNVYSFTYTYVAANGTETVQTANLFMEVAKDYATYALKNNGAWVYLYDIADTYNADAIDTAVVMDSIVLPADDEVDCGDAVKAGKVVPFYVSGDDVYAVGGTEWAVFNGEFVPYGAQDFAFQPHTWDAKSLVVKATDVKGVAVPVTVECSKCEKTFPIVYKTAFDNTWVRYVNYDVATGTGFEKMTDYYIVLNAVAADAPAADATEKVESAETFDAGIAMYVGMSVMAAAGSAVVLKKKD